MNSANCVHPSGTLNFNELHTRLMMDLSFDEVQSANEGALSSLGETSI